MPSTTPQTIGEALYWSYANLAMMMATLDDGSPRPTSKHFRIRSRLYWGLCSGRIDVTSFFSDERIKLKLPKACYYCGSVDNLSADHIIPQSKGGSHGGENLVYSCRRCNSSKGSKDLLEWMGQRGQFPPLYLLRRYLKMAIEFSRERNLMSVPLSEATSMKGSLPFSVDHLPHNKFPRAAELCLWVSELADAKEGEDSVPS